MPVNDFFQKRNLINKIGLGVPRMNQPNPSPSPIPPKKQPPIKPVPASPPSPNPTPKPPCGSCRRQRAS